MIILSIDIGVKNLALIHIDINTTSQEYNILSWKLLNLSDPEAPPPLCEGFRKNGCVCGAKASFYSKIKTEKHFYCKTHSKDVETTIKPIPKRKAKKPDVNDICSRLIDQLDQNPDLLKCDTILIENQPSLMNPMIKSVQMMVFTYFHMRYFGKSERPQINLVHANQKNKVFKNDPDPDPPIKSKYTRTKRKGVIACRRMIGGTDLEYFDGHNKKDDLSDAFLQAWSFVFY